MKILIIRRDCRGDVIAATSVLQGLRKKYPDAYIAWLINPIGDFKEIITGLSEINEIVYNDTGQWDLKIDLDHNKDYSKNMVEVYCEQAGVEFNYPKMHISEDDEKFANFAKDKLIISYHAGWKNRQYTKMQKVIDILFDNKIPIVELDDMKYLNNVIYVRTTIKQAAAIMKTGKMYFGPDTMGMHLAIVFRKRMVVLCCPTGPENRFMPNSRIIRNVEEPCYGFNRKTGDCKFKDKCPFPNALELIEPEEIAKIILEEWRKL